MKSNNELKEIDIENCKCYYFDDIMRAGELNFNNVLLSDINHINHMKTF